MSHNWKHILITPNHTIRDALTCINNESLRVALVVDANNTLLGVVTDGDIRRGLLNNLSLDTSVFEVMNTKPITVSTETSNSSLIKLMKEKNILFVPRLNNGQVVGLETLHDAIKTPRYDNPVFLMAGGFGTRLKPLTDNCPKPMLKIGKKPILEIVIQSFINAGFWNFYISTHYMADQIREYFGNGSQWKININYVHEELPLGTGGALGLLPKDIPDLPVIMMNGDVLTNVDLQQLLIFHTESCADVTMCVRKYEYQVPYGVIEGKGNRVINMTEKPIQCYFVNAGIYVVDSDVVKSVPVNFKIDMPKLLERKMELGRNILMFPIHEYWMDIGRMDDFKQAQYDISSLSVV